MNVLKRIGKMALDAASYIKSKSLKNKLYDLTN